MLVLDEPTRGMDGAHKASRAGMARELAASGKAVVLTAGDVSDLSDSLGDGFLADAAYGQRASAGFEENVDEERLTRGREILSILADRLEVAVDTLDNLVRPQHAARHLLDDAFVVLDLAAVLGDEGLLEQQVAAPPWRAPCPPVAGPAGMRHHH